MLSNFGASRPYRRTFLRARNSAGIVLGCCKAEEITW